MDDEGIPLVHHDDNDDKDDDDEETENPFTSTPGPSGERPSEKIPFTTFKGGEKGKGPKIAETSFTEGNIDPERAKKKRKKN